MLTTRKSRENIGEILPNTRGLVLDYLASGIDPEGAPIYLQSAVPETHELHTYLKNLVSVAPGCSVSRASSRWPGRKHS